MRIGLVASESFASHLTISMVAGTTRVDLIFFLFITSFLRI